MHMHPDEIVVRYRQAKEKGKQIKILAELNACSVEEIMDILYDYGYTKKQMGGAIRFLNSEKDTEDEVHGKENISPETAGRDVEDAVPYKENGNAVMSLEQAMDVIKAELDDINRQQYLLDLRKADIYQKIRDMFGEVVS